MYKPETRFRFFHEKKERELQNLLPLEKISEDTKVPLDIVKLMSLSHIKDISSIPIGDICKVADYLDANFHNFIFIPGETPKGIAKVVDDHDELFKPYTQSHCENSNQFRIAIDKAKYRQEYYAVDGLINAIANLVDNNPNVKVGVVQNVCIKLQNDNVLVRFFVKDNKVFIKRVLFGNAIGNDKLGLYKKIYDQFKTVTGKDSVEEQSDVDTLVSIINNNIPAAKALSQGTQAPSISSATSTTALTPVATTTPTSNSVPISTPTP
ncbi:hypothetical protein [Clostridium sp. HMP27]|uniref:hypothetical protein n=1 Tax=Clostridium sp. HMP27 TaxID=1487921 RepID=UPI00052D1F3A|nr:hypothetical protein [Clostridium sp. HMP27]KGK87359.1 hypothetical protein DP68_11305 [Clostridium sp. HMP27]